MDGDVVTRHEWEQYLQTAKSEHDRLAEENKRQNERLKEVEQQNKQINNLALEIRDLNASIKNVVKENERLGNLMQENISKTDGRLKKIEERDGEKWRDMIKYVGTTILGIVIGLVLKHIGLM